MTNDRDPGLEDLFDVARQDLPGEMFAAEVISRIDKMRRRTMVSWIVVGLVLAYGAWLLAAPVQDMVQLLTEVLPVSLVDLGDRWVGQFLSPVNSVSSVVGIGLLGLWWSYRKLFT